MNHDGRVDIAQVLRVGAAEKLSKERRQMAQRQFAEGSSQRCFTKVLSSLSWRDRFYSREFFEETIAGQKIRVKQVKNGETRGFGTGAMVWPAACMLMKYLDFHFQGKNQSLNGKNVIELGSGTGAVGLAAAMLGAKCVLTDQKSILFLTKENRRLLFEQEPQKCWENSVFIREYNWGDSIGELGTKITSFQYVLVSDCILPKLYPMEPLIEAIDALCSCKTIVLVAYERRIYEKYDPKLRFIELVTEKGFQIRELDDSELHPEYQVEDIEIWELKRGNN